MEQAVQFIAKPAPFHGDDFPEQAREVQGDFFPPVNIQILKRDGEEVCFLKRGKYAEVWF